MEHRSTPPVQEMINAEALPPSLSAPTSAAAQVHGETTASLERDYAENKTHVSSQELVSFDEDTGDEGQRKAEADHGDTEEQANGHASAFDEAPPAPVLSLNLSAIEKRFEVCRIFPGILLAD